MERFGFVGLPNAGKSSLYNALAGGGALAAPYAFATVDPNVGVAKVPDDRIQRLAVMSQTKTIVPASVQFVDIAGLVQGLSEGVHFAQKAGLNIPAVMETISKGAAGSWQMENRWKTMSEGKFDFGFAVDWMRKDLAISLDEARRNGASLPVAALVDQFYSEVQKMGGSRWDTSSLVARLNNADKK